MKTISKLLVNAKAVIFMVVRVSPNSLIKVLVRRANPRIPGSTLQNYRINNRKQVDKAGSAWIQAKSGIEKVD